jgi:hypothetical protein
MRLFQLLISWFRRDRHDQLPTLDGVAIPTSNKHSKDSLETRQESSKVSDENDVESQRQHLRKNLLQTSTRFRIHLHISQLDNLGHTKDLGPWPEHVAQVSNLEDAMDLCTMLSHQIPGLLFPKERAS